MVVAKAWPACAKLIGQPISIVTSDAMSPDRCLQRGQEAIEDVGALGGCGARPGAVLEGGARRRDGAVDVGRARRGDAPDDLFREGRTDLDPLRGRRLLVCSTDVQRVALDHACRLLGVK